MNCAGLRLAKFIDLGTQPNGNNFPLAGEEHDEPRFPIAMLVCEDCWQVQIAEFPSQEFLFSDHPYVTGVNVPVVEHFRRLAPHVISKLGMPKSALTLDIGCNDGALLHVFQDLGMRVLGVEPGRRVAALARQRGITPFEVFWNSTSARNLSALRVYPDLITATAVFYHLPDLHDFIEGLAEVMTDDTVFVVQCVSLLDLITKNQFDHFYHEHSCIHSITALSRLFSAHEMKIIDVERWDIHGGSFVAYVTKREGPRVESGAARTALEEESKAGLTQFSTYEAFAGRVNRNARDLRSLLEEIRGQGKTVVALGAPVKGNTLLNYCEIGPDLVQCATEVNSFKIGRLTPGTHIPIVAENDLDKAPDYYLVLSWNFLDFFLSKYKSYLMKGGRFIVPVPEVRVLTFDRGGFETGG
jgi:SAM-dependent methyltransferase